MFSNGSVIIRIGYNIILHFSLDTVDAIMTIVLCCLFEGCSLGGWNIYRNGGITVFGVISINNSLHFLLHSEITVWFNSSQILSSIGSMQSVDYNFIVYNL